VVLLRSVEEERKDMMMVMRRSLLVTGQYVLHTVLEPWVGPC